MLVGVAAIPLLIDGMGLERFGMLSIAWMIVGYFGVLDMGLGRALTQRVAYKIGSGELNHIKALVIVSLVVVLVLGSASGLLVSFFAEVLVYDLFNISSIYLVESLKGIYWVAATIPLVILSTALFGVLEGQQYFGWTALVRAPLNLLMFVAPLIALQWSADLDVIFSSLFWVRLVGLIALVIIVYATLAIMPKPEFSWQETKLLFSFGGWITVSNIVSPMMVYFDRFYIAAVLSVSVVAYYTTPLDLLIKVLLVPLALVGVMFAIFSSEWSTNKRTVINHYRKSIITVFIVMAPFTIVAVLLADYGLTLWLGAEFAEQSYKITQVIAVGVFFNAMAMVPYALIQGIGRADITAKFHLLELPIFLVLLWFFVDAFGLIGAAYAWTIRVTLDAMLLYWYAQSKVREASCVTMQ
jgi:O-antigen/teichoic acid export membrane protein